MQLVYVQSSQDF